MLICSVAPPASPELHHHFDLPDDERIRRHGRGTHTPIDQLTVSEPTTVVFEWTIGEQTVATGGELLVCWRWPYDWSDLQSKDPSAAGFMRAELTPAAETTPDSAEVELAPVYNWFSGIEPWHHQIHVKVSSGELKTGDTVRLICGVSESGEGNWRAPTCVDKSCEFLMAIDFQGDAIRTRLVQEPSFEIKPGPPVRLTAIVHSDAIIGEPAELIIRGEDCWGNPTELDSPPVIGAVSEAEAATVSIVLTPIDADSVRPAYRHSVTFSEPGVFRLFASSDDLSTVSNPVTIHKTKPELSLFWGDVHSGQTEIGCGSGTLAESYAFGRDCAGLQFITHQANDHYVTLDDWNHTREVTEQFYEPGVYVPFLGCEWSPFTKDGGDRNVIYNYDETVLRRSDRFFREDEPDPTPDVPTAPQFHDAFRDLDVLVNIHVGGRMTNLDWYEQKIEKLCETHSTHGTVEWFFMDALSRGYKVGLTAGTDGVMGRPGACHPGRRLIRNLRNGLTAVYAKELTREAMWEALQARRCYATTGERIRLQFKVNDADMGSAIDATGSPRIQFRVEGTKAIERVDLFRGVEIIEAWQVAGLAAQTAGSTLVRVLWGGTERKGTARLQRVDWTGSLLVSNGTVELVEPVNFQSYDDAATSTSESRIEWQNKSAGNAAGILIRVSGDDSTELTFDSAPTQFRVSLSEIRNGIHKVDAGGVGRFAQIGPAVDSAGSTFFEMETSDDEQLTGEFPYWIRVTQIDQSLAWSSPVYVTRK
ncbi:MAG: DUF3604 domain-containing protein [Planctomycetota bacterium]|mgnify:CR=1 FL=1|nr:DUF3604 domain-containing protein [Planctomycetota bacterium]MDA1248799.1 DUF3604 domain-containing protein [Planctomycetota bacterium]